MEGIESYLQIMIEGLTKKEALLDILLDKNKAQLQCVKGKEYEDVDWDVFNLLVSEKDVAINKINEIDDGFTDVYERIRDEVINNKDKYRDQVQKLQELITRLTEKGARIQTEEERNRQIIDAIFQKTRQQIKTQRTSINVASNYYRTMSNSVVRAAEDSILDTKK
jgi:gas vesicle protein